MANKSTRWFHRHVHDSWVKKAQKEGKRSRAVFKLTQIFSQYKTTLPSGGVIVDLGCAPGSWCSEIRVLCPKSAVIGIDTLPMDPIEGVTLLQHDFLSPEGQQALSDLLTDRVVELVLSDLAPEMSGNRIVDQSAAIGLNEATINFCQLHLNQGGTLLMKSFMGEGFDQVRHSLRQEFARVKSVKPAASRKDSREIFLLATGYNRGGE
ncbi:MAG: RlmE family RNA methyltransferase [Mariprofundales bacterium]|nr:RlmE family RNA methyltransferase [Mariprofundales bacterium]